MNFSCPTGENPPIIDNIAFFSVTRPKGFQKTFPDGKDKNSFIYTKKAHCTTLFVTLKR